MATYFLEGLALGFGSGVAPGPMFALVLSAALRGGFRNGAVVAMAPLITDIPIVILCLTVVSQLSDDAVRALTLAGAAVLLWYAYEAARDARTTSLADLRGSAERAPSARRSLRQGVVANFLNPSPWLFWLGVGGPLVTRAWDEAPLNAAAFVVPFYALLVGSKVVLAWAVGAGRGRLSDRSYRAVLVAAAVMLLGLAASLVMRALG